MSRNWKGLACLGVRRKIVRLEDTEKKKYKSQSRKGGLNSGLYNVGLIDHGKEFEFNHHAVEIQG